MKHITLSLLLTFALGSLFAQGRSYRPKSIVFKRIDTCITTDSGKCDSIRAKIMNDYSIHMLKSLKEGLVAEYPEDTINMIMPDIQSIFREFIQITSNRNNYSELTVTSKADTIRRYLMPKYVPTSYERIEENGKIYSYASRDSNFVYSTQDLFKNPGDYTVLVNLADEKIILGIKCYKVQIIEKEIIDMDLPFELGDKVYDMYVTNTISLPLHSIIPVKKKFTEFFPLQIKEWYTKSPELFVFYEAKKIVK